MKRKNIIFTMMLLVLTGTFSACTDNTDTETYDNKAFITTNPMNSILLKGQATDQGVIKTAIAKLEDNDVTVTYMADPSKVNQFNNEYGEKAVALPENIYSIDNPVSTIGKGTLEGNDVIVNFKGLDTLDRDVVYVLPISVKSSNLEVLRSAKTVFFVFKGGALINSAADITKNYLYLKSPNGSLSGMDQMTVECLVNVSKFGKQISTIMGIENNFLIRIGDAGVPDNQIQLATSYGNVTDPNWILPTGEWVHIAVTWENSTGATDVYINGVKKGVTQYSNYRSSVNWGKSNFYVGKSYDDNRWLEALICEVRIWNRVLSADEIQAKNHFYTVEPNSEGLIAYWKFDEATGNSIADHTGNGNDLVCANDLTWKTISLPAK